MFSMLFTTWGKRCSYGLTALFLILICTALFDSQKQFRENHRSITRTPGTITENKPRAMQTHIADFSKIPSQHLFGHAPIEAQDVPISSLQLRLIGILVAESPKASRVIISEAGRAGKVFGVGDSIGAIRINAVTPNGVILENHGRLEKLPMQRETLSFLGKPKKLLSGD